MTRSVLFDKKRKMEAKKAGRAEAKTLRLWFRSKYNLAPTDPRYLAATDQEIETEYWAYQYKDNKVQDEIEDDDFDLAAVEAQMEREAIEAEAARLQAKNVDDWEDVDLG